MLADQLDALEVGHDGRHHERKHALAGELAGCGARGRLELVVFELEAEATKLLGELGAWKRGVVGDEAERVPLGAQACDGLDGARNRLTGDVRTSSMSSRMQAMLGNSLTHRVAATIV